MIDKLFLGTPVTLSLSLDLDCFQSLWVELFGPLGPDLLRAAGPWALLDHAKTGASSHPGIMLDREFIFEEVLIPRDLYGA